MVHISADAYSDILRVSIHKYLFDHSDLQEVLAIKDLTPSTASYPWYYSGPRPLNNYYRSSWEAHADLGLSMVLQHVAVLWTLISCHRQLGSSRSETGPRLCPI